MLEAGTYYVGDLCYVFGDDDWPEICEAIEKSEDGYIEHKGFTMFFANTKYGDGTYTDQYGYDYSVDAGLIGAVAIKHLSEEFVRVINNGKLGQVHEFERSFTCSEDDGVIMIGKYIINTGDTEEYEDDDWNDDWDDEEEEDN